MQKDSTIELYSSTDALTNQELVANGIKLIVSPYSNNILQNNNVSLYKEYYDTDAFFKKLIDIYPQSAIFNGIKIKNDTNNNTYNYLHEKQFFTSLMQACIYMNIAKQSVVILTGFGDQTQDFSELRTPVPKQRKNQKLAVLAVSETFTLTKATSIGLKNSNGTTINQNEQQYKDWFFDENNQEISYITLQIVDANNTSTYYVHPSRALLFQYDTTLSNEYNKNAQTSQTSLADKINLVYSRYSAYYSSLARLMQNSSKFVFTTNSEAKWSNDQTIEDNLSKLQDSIARKDTILEYSGLGSDGKLQKNIEVRNLDINFNGWVDFQPVFQKEVAASMDLPISFLFGFQLNGGLTVSQQDRLLFNSKIKMYADLHLTKHLDKILRYLAPQLSEGTVVEWEYKEAVGETEEEQMNQLTQKTKILTDIANATEKLATNGLLLDKEELQASISDKIKEMVSKL